VHEWVIKIGPHHLQGGGARSWVDTSPHPSMEGRDQGGGGLDIHSCSVHLQTIQKSKRQPATFKLEWAHNVVLFVCFVKSWSHKHIYSVVS
jgi:hypothetical protein